MFYLLYDKSRDCLNSFTKYSAVVSMLECDNPFRYIFRCPVAYPTLYTILSVICCCTCNIPPLGDVPKHITFPHGISR